jgi:hypothetical protein
VKEAKPFGLEPLSLPQTLSFSVALYLRSWVTQQTSRFPVSLPERTIRPFDDALADKQNKQSDLPESDNT